MVHSKFLKFGSFCYHIYLPNQLKFWSSRWSTLWVRKNWGPFPFQIFCVLWLSLTFFSKDWSVIDVRRGLESLKQLLTVLSWSRQEYIDGPENLSVLDVLKVLVLIDTKLLSVETSWPSIFHSVYSFPNTSGDPYTSRPFLCSITVKT